MNPTTSLTLAALAVATALLTTACGDAASASTSAHSVSLTDTPNGLPAMTPPADFTEVKAELGKKLFFDTRLSSDNSMSCETCHVHEKGWTDGIRFSKKVNGSLNTRNSPTLYNTGYHKLLYWDGRAPSLEANIGAAWKGHMGGGDEVIATINGVEGYKKEFQDAFSGPATAENVASALAHFVRTLRAGDSAYDRAALGDEKLSADAYAGQQLFMGKAKCSTCHMPPLFTDAMTGAFHNAGFGEKPDVGRGKYDEALPGAFKTPTLRNVTKSSPYFHDGSVSDLRKAVTLMAGGGIDNPNLDPILRQIHDDKTKLIDQEIDQLMAFLKALESNESFERPTLPE